MPENRNKLIIWLVMLLVAGPVLAGHYAGWSWAVVKYPLYFDAVVLAVLSLFYFQKYLIVYGFAFLLSWALFSWASFNIDEAYQWSNILVPASFWLIYLGCWLIYFEIGRSRMGQNIKSWSPAAHFFYYLGFMLVSAVSSLVTVAHIFQIPLSPQVIPKPYYLFFGFMIFIIPTLTIYLLNIINTIGSNHIFHFLTGAYKRPVEVMRIVVVIDMVGSTKAAEKLLPQKSMELISHFIFDAGYVFRTHGGDLINYTGDGLIVIWPIDRIKQALKSIRAFEKRLRRYEADYRKRYDYIPRFRAGIHAGRVVLSQVGEDRLFLSIYGDVVNTAARLEQMNKQFGTHVLLSASARRLLQHDGKYIFKSLGTPQIDGKEKDLEVFTLAEPEEED